LTVAGTYYGQGQLANATWGYWNQQQVSITVTSTVASTGAWQVWNNAQVANITASTTTNWVSWNNAITFQQYGQQANQPYIKPLSPAQVKKAQEDAEERARVEQAEKLAAKGRARKLLVRHLSVIQKRVYEEHGYFDVEVSGKVYRVRQGTHGNVRKIEQVDGRDREVMSFCIQPGGVPEEDAMLAQKLLLETDEAMFLRIANARPMQVA
jgi:hypothetical protein